MPFERVWDDSCPRVWDRWEADGTTWIVQDLPPEDEVEAVDILLKHLCPDETFFSLNKLVEDPVSVIGMTHVWKLCFAQRVSLGCYAISDGKKKLVGLNVCSVKDKEDDQKEEIRGEPLLNLYQTMKYLEKEVWSNRMEYMGLDEVLSGLGLVVRREYRGAKLGARILAAREPLCRAIGVKGTSTIFSGPASQKLALKCGFTFIKEITIRELAEAGLKYPKDNDTVVKLMGKMYD